MTKREIGIGVACLALGLLGGILLNLPEDDPSSRSYQDEVAAERAAEGEAADVDVVDEPEVVPTIDDFSMAVRTKDEECFGSAGCNVTVGLVPEYTGASVGDAAWEITYELKGIDDGSSIGTFTLDGDELSWTTEERVSTKSPSTKVRAEITSVDRAY